MAVASKGTKKKAVTKAQLAAALQTSDYSKAMVLRMLDDLAELATRQLKQVGKFTIPGLVILNVRRKPKVAGGEQRMGPKGPYITKPQPARNVVKARPVKAVKDAVA